MNAIFLTEINNKFIVSPEITELDTTERFLLGQGYNANSGKPRGHTVKNRKVGSITPSNGTETTYTLKVIEDSFTLQKTLNVGISASFKSGIYSAKGSYSSFASTSINSYDCYIFAEIESVNIAKHLKEFILEDAALQKLENGFEEFLAFAGNYFVSGLQDGSRLSAIIRIFIGRQEDYRAIKTSISAKIGAFGGGSASFEETIKQCTENRETEIFISRSGSNENLPSIENFIEYSRTIPSIAENEPYPLTIFLSDYDVVQNMTYGIIDYDLLTVQRNKLQELSRLLLTQKSNLGDLLFAKNNRDLFVDHDGKLKENLEDEIDGVVKNINTIIGYAELIIRKPLENFPDLSYELQINLERKALETISPILIIYSGINFTESQREINETVSSLPQFNDAIRSFKLIEGYTATFFWDSGFRGASFTIIGPSECGVLVPFAFDKKISSIIISTS